MRRTRGFTLLEVMVAGGLLAVLTAAAMAAFVAQVKLTNAQQQAANATDSAREALRLIANDLRAAAPGISAALVAGGASSICPTGTIPFDPGSGALACLPPVFRSSVPIAPVNSPGVGFALNACGLGTVGYQLQVGPGQVEPSLTPFDTTHFFCPDDLVILAVDDADAYFVSGLPMTSIGNTMPANFALTQAAGMADGLDASDGALAANPMVLLSGAQGPALLCNSPLTTAPCTGGFVAPVPSPWGGGAVGGTTAANWGSVPVTLRTQTYNLFGSLGTGTPAAMPARVVQYAIEPVDASGQPVGLSGQPAVDANLVRTVVAPAGSFMGPSANSGGWFTVISSTILVKGVVDMQVEFGFDPNSNGQLQYSNSAGFQSTYWSQAMGIAGTAPPVATATPTYNVCNGDPLTAYLFGGTCFPDQQFQALRSVRVNLTARNGAIVNSRSIQGLSSTAGTAAPFLLQPAVQDLTTGNLEAAQWGFTWAPPTSTTGFAGFPTVDGAQWREMSTEIAVRNLALSASY